MHAGPSDDWVPLVSRVMSPTDPRHRTGPQEIPRPPSHRPGGDAPWAHLDGAVRSSVRLDAVVAAVRSRDRTADAAAVATEVSEFSRSFSDAFPNANPAAVLVALFEEGGEARVLLTVRSARLRSHQGEVAFPGGKLDRGEGIWAPPLRGAVHRSAVTCGLQRSVSPLLE